VELDARRVITSVDSSAPSPVEAEESLPPQAARLRTIARLRIIARTFFMNSISFS
jgi:hypothetical protein